jgi:hypothetical protein
MTPWTSDELDTIGRAEELQIAPLRRDRSLDKGVTIWIVRHGDDLYIRAWRGRGGAWFRAAQARHEGHIRAGGVDKDVAFVEETDPDINDALDAAYCTKYGHYASYVPPMTSPHARHDAQARAALNKHLILSYRSKGKENLTWISNE